MQLSRTIQNRALVGAVVLVGMFTQGARATIIQSWSGLSSTNVQVAFEAHFTISGNTLTIDLHNNSPVHSQNPNDLLSSFYFDVVCGGTRPTLTYTDARGDVWQTPAGAPDFLVTANANLRATAAGDNTWQFKVMNPSLAPFLGFGIGTVGNNGLSPNNFMGNIVNGRDYSIYRGDITTSNLNNELLVKDHAVFTFTGVSGCTEADIVAPSAFGLGTAPDSLEFTPEPGSLALLLAGSALGLSRRRK